jgi:type I restriction enzyme S subunit
MKLIRLGDYIEFCDKRNSDESLGEDDVRGISTRKEFIMTKADLYDVSLKSYKIVDKNDFAFVSDTSRRGDKISLAFNDLDKKIIVSSISTVFRITDVAIINPYYLFMYFKRPEFDRFARYNSWGSAREVFSIDDFCDIKINIPPLDIQNKFVNIYLSLIQNQKAYKSNQSDLKLVCDSYIEKLKYLYPYKSISDCIELVTEANSNNEYGLKDVVGVSQEKFIIPTKADASHNDLSKFTIIHPLDFVYNPRNGVAIGLNDFNKNYIISWNNTAFRIKNDCLNLINPKYLFMFMCRSERDRKVKFDSWGSSTEVYSFEELKNTKIPFAPLNIQNDIVEIFNSYKSRMKFEIKVNNMLQNICSILIAGSIKEAHINE